MLLPVFVDSSAPGPAFAAALESQPVTVSFGSLRSVVRLSPNSNSDSNSHHRLILRPIFPSSPSQHPYCLASRSYALAATTTQTRIPKLEAARLALVLLASSLPTHFNKARSLRRPPNLTDIAYNSDTFGLSHRSIRRSVALAAAVYSSSRSQQRHQRNPRLSTISLG